MNSIYWLHAIFKENKFTISTLILHKDNIFFCNDGNCFYLFFRGRGGGDNMAKNFLCRTT